AGQRLKITEIFYSLQGEAAFSGWPTVFVRLTGCPLRCQYCDTAYAFTGGEWRTFAEIEAEVRGYATPYVCLTGGEPLAQPRCARCSSRRATRSSPHASSRIGFSQIVCRCGSRCSCTRCSGATSVAGKRGHAFRGAQAETGTFRFSRRAARWPKSRRREKRHV